MGASVCKSPIKCVIWETFNRAWFIDENLAWSEFALLPCNIFFVLMFFNLSCLTLYNVNLSRLLIMIVVSLWKQVHYSMLKCIQTITKTTITTIMGL